MEQYRGGCVCGSVRFELGNHPLWVVACHCDACKKRTGSAFGISVVADAKSVKEFAGQTRTFTRVGDSGRPVSYDFCTKCGTTVRWHVDLISRQVFAGGAFDQAKTLRVFGEMYVDEAMPWARLGCDLYRLAAPDDEFRAKMIERTALSR